MDRIFYTVERDATQKLPPAMLKTEGTHSIHVLPFIFDEAVNAVYAQRYARLLSYTELLDVVEEGSTLYVPMEDPLLLGYEQKDLPTNPRFYHISTKKPLEVAIYYSLLIFNENYNQKKLLESELYYIFKNALATHNQRVPAPVYLLAANILYNELQGKDHIALLDWHMLPALMLLLPYLERGCKVHLPAYDKRLMRPQAHALLVEFFQQEIPRIHWHTAPLDMTEFKDYLATTPQQHSTIPTSPKENTIAHGALVLGSLFPENAYLAHETLYQLRPMRGGFLFTSWNFLARASFQIWRRILFKENMLRSIIQLPKLLRSGTKDYGAGLILANPKTERSALRMCYMPPSYKEGEEALDQASLISYINGNEEQGQCSFLVETRQIETMLDLRLSPSVYFIEETRPSTQGRLGEYAEILFYSKPRKKMQDDAPPLGKDFVQAQEISLSDIDASSSFVFAEEKKFTVVKMNALLNKYLVQNGDILLAFKGSATSIGKSGFVVNVDPLGYTLTNQSTCVIRALPHRDAVWLYYQLKSPQSQEWIRAHSSGSNALVISLEMLRNLPLEAYDSTHAEKLYTLHRQMLEEYKAVNAHKHNLRKSREQIKKILGW